MSNKNFPATLIPADFGHHQSSPDVDNLGITQYEVRPGRVYLNPAEIIDWSGGPWGVPWWAHQIALQTTFLGIITAPTPWQKSIQFQFQNTPLYTAGQAPFGSAPTSGVFTGVDEEACK